MFFAGSITATGGNTAINNLSQPTNIFALGPSVRGVYLQSDSSGVQFEMFAATGAFTSTGRAAYLPGPNILSGPYRTPSMENIGVVISVMGAGSGSVRVKVFVSPTG